MNHILVFIVLLILITINVIYYYSYNNNIKNHIKENFADITKFEYVNRLLSSNTNIKCSLYDQSRNCGYYTGLTGRITKIDFNKFTESHSIILNKVSKIESGFIDKKAEFAYFLTNTQPSIIIKVNLNNFSKKDEKEKGTITYGVLPPTYDNVSLSTCDSDSKYAYLISTSSFTSDNKYILKVDLDKYNYVENIDNVVYYTVKYDNPLISDLAYYNTKNNTHIKVGLLAPYTPQLTPTSFTLDKIEQNLYFGTNLGIHKYVLNNPNAFTSIPIYTKIYRAGTNTIFQQNDPNKIYSTGQTQIKSCIINDMNQYGFFTTNDSKLLKIDMSAFIEDHTSFTFDKNPLITTITLTGITETKNMIIDADNKYLYGDSTNGKIFKMDINSNNINVLNLPSSDVNGGLILDKENRFLYSSTSGNNHYILKIKIKDYLSTPKEEEQTDDATIPTISADDLPLNYSLEQISTMQNSINSIVNANESEKSIKSNLEKISTTINSVLAKQTTDHAQIKTSMELTNAELQNTLNVINEERAKLNLSGNESYLLKPPQKQEQFANLIQHKIHPRINDFINIQPDWRIEWNKNMHNANINPLLVLP
jgi:hypothetical protein